MRKPLMAKNRSTPSGPPLSALHRARRRVMPDDRQDREAPEAVEGREVGAMVRHPPCHSYQGCCTAGSPLRTRRFTFSISTSVTTIVPTTMAPSVG